jgi:hypothetical protein
MFTAIAMCVVLTACGAIVGPEKPLNLEIVAIGPDGGPLNEHLKEARLYRSTNPDETDPANMTLVATVAIPYETGFDENGDPWRHTFTDIDQVDMTENVAYYYRWLATDWANNKSGLSPASEETIVDATPPLTPCAPEVIE